MSERTPERVAIVDYGMGNLFSVARACEHAGLDAVITSSAREVLDADGVVLPGVGGMPEAMRALDAGGLSDAIRECVARSTPLLAVCLGMQLLMRDGSEFEPHEGLGIIPGRVVRFQSRDADGRPLRVPHIGWNVVARTDAAAAAQHDGLCDGALLYFVHSYYVEPADDTIITARTTYGGTSFCSVLTHESIFACQAHPERSGAAGLAIYDAFARRIRAHLPTSR